MATRRGSLLVLAAAVAFTAACGATSAPQPTKPAGAAPPAQGAQAETGAAAAPPAKAPVPLTVAWDFALNGFEAPMYAALARGYYKAQGLDVRFVEGNSASVASQWVATGKVDMAFTGVDQAVKTVPQGAPVKIVAMIMQQSPFGLIYRSDQPIRRPADVYGRTIGTLPGSQADISLREFISQAGLDASKLKITDVSANAVAGLFGQGKLDVFAAAAYGFLPPLEKLGLPVGFYPFSNLGVGATGESVEASTHLLQDHPDVVKGFLYATAQGFAFAQAHPEQAVADEVQAVPSLKPDITLAQLKLVFPLLHTRNTEGKPWGWQSADDWRAQIELLQRFEGVKQVLPLADYYTNGELPAGPVVAP